MSANGRLRSNELARIYSPLCVAYLRRGGVAAGWNTMVQYCWLAGVPPPYPATSDSAYRTFAQQVAVRRWWCDQGACGNAAVPGYSRHGEALAVDDIRRHAWIRAHGRRFGWGCDDAPWEGWHNACCHGARWPNPGISRVYPVLAVGSGGPLGHVVRRCQQLLRKHGYRAGAEGSGNFTRATAGSVKRFQKAHRLRQTGVVDRRTWIALNSKPKAARRAARR